MENTINIDNGKSSNYGQPMLLLPTWVLFFRTTWKSDGKRVETKAPLGLVKDFQTKVMHEK